MLDYGSIHISHLAIADVFHYAVKGQVPVVVVAVGKIRHANQTWVPHAGRRFPSRDIIATKWQIVRVVVWAGKRSLM